MTSTRTRDSRKAESALAAYIAQKDRPGGPRRADQLTVADALSIYGEEHAATVRAPETIGYSIKALLPLSGALPVGSLKTAWRTALAASDIDHCTRHDLRHTAVAWAMQRGADKWAAAGFFGLSLDMLESVYGHHHPDHLRSAVEAMERKA